MAYTPNEWGVGNLITASKMNKIERQLVVNTSDLDDIRNGVTVPTYEEFEDLVNNTVHVNEAQTLTTAQKDQARDNIEAASEEEVTSLKSALSEQTYNLVTGKRENITVNSSGGFVNNTGTDMIIAPVVANQAYTVKTNDASGLVCGFFSSDPYAYGVKTYNNSRTIQQSKTITAPITGWIAFRSLSGYNEAQIVEGSEDKPYIPPITAKDTVARNMAEANEGAITELQTEHDALSDTVNDVITEQPIYEDVTDYTITDNAFKKFTDGQDSEASNFEYASVSVNTGEIYSIACMAGQWAKAWIVLNSNGAVIAYSSIPTSTPVAPVSDNVTIPENGATLVVNNRKDGTLSIKKYAGTFTFVDGASVYVDGKTLPEKLSEGNTDDVLTGKILCCCGDSITYGDDMDAEGLTNESNIDVFQSDGSGNFTKTTSNFRKTWNWQIASRNRMTLYNAGVNGSTMQGLADKNGFSLANGRYTKLPETIDYLLIWFGWNDTAYGTLGTINDSTNESYYGGYNVVLPYLINKYPYTKIGLIVPFGTDEGHRNAIRLLGNKWGVAVWDNYQGGTPLYYGKETSVGVEQAIVTSNRAKFQANGAHPNFKGHRQLGNMIEAWLRSI